MKKKEWEREKEKKKFVVENEVGKVEGVNSRTQELKLFEGQASFLFRRFYSSFRSHLHRFHLRRFRAFRFF
jgi:hypothetical protein